MFLRTSARRPATEPSSTPKRLMNSSVSSGSSRSSTFFRLITNLAALPFRFSAWYSSGKVTSMVNSSPALWPLIPSSKPGIIRPWPIASTKSDALPPSNSSPSTEPEKSMVTRSSASTAPSLSFQFACCLRRVSSMPSTSVSVTSTIGFSTSMVSRPFSSTSG
ncbi:hypothetical protein D3C85_1446370 [compost metagenome]